MDWTVVIHPDARTEIREVPKSERTALANVLDKLAALGPQLGFPHSSAIQGAEYLRELRPRRGNSAWRLFYRRIGDEFIIASVGPEATVSPRGFTKAVSLAQQRLDEWEHTS